MDLLNPNNWSWDLLVEDTLSKAGEIASDKLKTGTDSAIAAAKNAWAKVHWRKAEDIYRRSLHTNLSTTKVLGNPTAIAIEDIYTDVYVHDRPSAIRVFSQDFMEREFRKDLTLPTMERHHAVDISRTGDNLFVLGRPGSGKTTFLKYLALLACRGNITRVPIFISLKDLTDSKKGIIEFVEEQFDICGFPDAKPFVLTLLTKGKAIVLLDGLDEVGDQYGTRTQLIREVANLSRKYSACQYCLTCRTAATDYSFEQFKYLEIADFSNDQQKTFIKQWYSEKPEILNRFEEGWNDSYNNSLRELGKTPLLLTLLCLSFDQTLSFPARQVDLYREAIDALLRKWDSSRLIVRDDFYKRLSHSRREHLLESIASKFYFDSQAVFNRYELESAVLKYLSGLPDKEASTPTDARTVVQQIEAQHGLIVERAKSIYSFSHLTIQEFLTASHIVKNPAKNTFSELARLGLSDPKWREVVLFAAGLLPSADVLFAEMVSRLDKMRGVDPGVLKFLTLCYCESLMAMRKPHSRKKITVFGEFNAAEIRDAILNYANTTRHPSLSISEAKKVAENIMWMKEFLSRREGKYDFGAASAIIRYSAETLVKTPSVPSKILGGYFARPEAFLSYLYGCRVFVECMEVAVATNREKYLKRIMSTDVEATRTVAQELGVSRIE